MHGIDELNLVVLFAQAADGADHEVGVPEGESAADSGSLLESARVAELVDVDAVVDHDIALREDAAPYPMAALSLANENRAIGRPEQRPIAEHLNVLLRSEQPRRMVGNDHSRASPRQTFCHDGVQERVGVRRDDHRGLHVGDERGQFGQRRRVEETLRSEATNGTRTAQTNPIEQRVVVLDVRGVTFVAAIGEPVHQRNAVVLGASVGQRAGNE